MKVEWKSVSAYRINWFDNFFGSLCLHLRWESSLIWNASTLFQIELEQGKSLDSLRQINTFWDFFVLRHFFRKPRKVVLVSLNQSQETMSVCRFLEKCIKKLLKPLNDRNIINLALVSCVNNSFFSGKYKKILENSTLASQKYT